MVDRSLVEFVKEALGKGAARADIERALTDAGWSSEQIRSALAGFADAAFPVPVPLPRPYVSAREAFLYLVLFILLGIVACHLVALLWVLVDVWLPRDVANAYAIAAASGTIRWAVSALAVAMPLYFVLTWRLGRVRRRNSAMQGSRIRKWLTYLTLVVAASTLVGDLIALIYNLLSGDLTLRFFLKTLALAAVAGAVFVYYIRDAERAEEAAGAQLLDRALGGGVAAAVLVAAIAGIAVIDSPTTLRARERDQIRLTALRDVASAVDCYYSYEGGTPDTLETMRASLAARAATTTIAYACPWREQLDPATGASYEYRPLDGAAFELCATFDRASDDRDDAQTLTYAWPRAGGYRTMTAVHGEGRHCFTLEAAALDEDPDLVVR
jgi:hypothetical protein